MEEGRETRELQSYEHEHEREYRSVLYCVSLSHCLVACDRTPLAQRAFSDNTEMPTDSTERRGDGIGGGGDGGW